MKAYADFSKAKEIKVGDEINVRGEIATVTKIRPFGTVDAVTKSGRAVRVSGLAF